MIGRVFMKKRNIKLDFVLNIVASLLSTGTMQLLIYPRLAVKLSGEEYGLLLTVMGWVNVITLSLGNNLCNLRLLKDRSYDDKFKGEFNVLLLIALAISAIVTTVLGIVYEYNWLIILLLILATLLTVMRTYFTAEFKINIDYVNILIENLIVALGYGIGAFLLLEFLPWPLVFAFANFVGLVYIFFKTKIVKEKMCISTTFKATLFSFIALILSGLIGNLTTYLDRFIIYPILGGAAVSVYATAVYFAKTFNLILAPITSVLLSYLTQGKIKLNSKMFLTINFVIALMSGFFVLISITLGDFVLSFLYPQFIVDAREFELLGSIAILVGTASSFLNVIILFLAKTYWQTILSAIKIVIYLVFGYIFTKCFGVLGMLLAVLITNSAIYMISFILSICFIKRCNQEENVK